MAVSDPRYESRCPSRSAAWCPEDEYSTRDLQGYRRRPWQGSLTLAEIDVVKPHLVQFERRYSDTLFVTNPMVCGLFDLMFEFRLPNFRRGVELLFAVESQQTPDFSNDTSSSGERA